MQKIEFTKDGDTYRVINYNKKFQEIEIQNLSTKESSIVAFAHIPKKIKQLLRPLK